MTSMLVILGITYAILSTVIIVLWLLEGSIDLKTYWNYIKPKSRTERKVMKEIRRIEREIMEQKRLEELYVKRDELTKKLEGWSK
ncbi:hypothetical protein [Staphylococcus agnetis]|uniref:hypothetical protein n=1 Tax=Staphylococcus agnetis TaxID=985762 RepID=UPI0021D14FF7|nr:hypothetical protein [Staphylococcus agnetis]UXU63363.1 hypothetical protein MUA84_07415 [Staphylococcus agnetis]